MELRGESRLWANLRAGGWLALIYRVCVACADCKVTSTQGHAGCSSSWLLGVTIATTVTTVTAGRGQHTQ